MVYIYRYLILLFFIISTVLSLLLIQQNKIFLKNTNILKALDLFLYIAFTYNILSLSTNFIGNATLYYIPLLFLLFYFNKRLVLYASIYNPIILLVYIALISNDYTQDLAIKIGIVSGVGLLISIFLHVLLSQHRLLFYLSVTTVYIIAEFLNRYFINNEQNNYTFYTGTILVLSYYSLTIFIYILVNRLEHKRIEIANKLEGYTLDGLTGLYNFRQFDEHFLNIAPEVAQSVTICLLDIDNFKQINDNFGHEMGNQTLKNFADVIRTVLAQNFKKREYQIYRYGGEEFVILFKGHIENSDIIIESLRTELVSITTRSDTKLTFSAGISFNDLHAML